MVCLSTIIALCKQILNVWDIFWAERALRFWILFFCDSLKSICKNKVANRWPKTEVPVKHNFAANIFSLVKMRARWFHTHWLWLERALKGHLVQPSISRGLFQPVTFYDPSGFFPGKGQGWAEHQLSARSSPEAPLPSLREEKGKKGEADG